MAREFVSSFARVYPQASYSVIPINRGQSLDLGFHLQRCYQSARLLSGASVAASDDDWNRFLTECQRKVKLSEASLPSSGLLTLCSAARGPEWEVSCSYHHMDLEKLSHLSTAINPERGAVTVDLTRAMQRDHPSAKAARWTLERTPLESARSPGAFETVLVSTEDEALEGLVSNLYVWRDSRLQTAPEGRVLRGSMSAIVERLAAATGVPIEHSTPRLAECHLWDAAFLTSATRPMLPVRLLLDSTGAPLVDFPNKLPDTLATLILMLRQGLYECGGEKAKEEVLLQQMWCNHAESRSWDSFSIPI